jgi:hypothetical protein
MEWPCLYFVTSDEIPNRHRGQMKDFKAAKEGSVRGMDLLNELSEATGLPDELIGEELSRLISGAGKTTTEVTLDELREMLGSYLQDILLSAKDSFQNDEVVRSEIQAAALALESSETRNDEGVISMIEKFNDKSPSEKNTATFAMFQDLGSGAAADFVGEG